MNENNINKKGIFVAATQHFFSYLATQVSFKITIPCRTHEIERHVNISKWASVQKGRIVTLLTYIQTAAATNPLTFRKILKRKILKLLNK